MEIKNLKPSIRHLSEMKELLFDQKWAKNASDLELYYMYRDLSENDQDKEKIIQAELRYDITVIPGLMLGKEYNKTAGHDHPLVPNTQITYPEIYQVLEGKVIFLIQDSEKDQIKDIYAIKAQTGDRIIIPPNYEHLMINPNQKQIKTANWVCREFGSNVYKPFRSKHGFSYYAIKNEQGQIEWVKNKNYFQVPELKFKEPNLYLEELQIEKHIDMYQLVNNLEKLDFLKNPQNYNWN